MNRALALALAAVVIVAAVVVVLADGRPAAPESVQSMADNYARYLSFSSLEPVSVERITRAAHPERFGQNMSKATYGDSVYYRTVYSLEQMAETGQPRPGNGGRAVSFPPKELWCVLLSDGSLVVVGQHLDLYNADWVLHEVVDASEVDWALCPASVLP
jgi:hypothetical protein